MGKKETVKEKKTAISIMTISIEIEVKNSEVGKIRAKYKNKWRISANAQNT